MWARLLRPAKPAPPNPAPPSEHRTLWQACQATLGTAGLHGSPFRACLTKYLGRALAPMFAAAKAARGSQTRMDAMCPPHQTQMVPHQLVIYELAKLMAVVPPEKMGEHRGLLAWHSTGSGKTLTSLAIAMAFWNTQKSIILVSTPVNTTAAMRDFKTLGPVFFAKECAAIAAAYRAKAHAPNLSVAEAFALALDKRVCSWNFVKARHRIAAKRPGEFKMGEVRMEDGEGSVLIIDEAQGLFMKDKNDHQSDAILLGKALRSMSKEKMRKIHVFAMTATPGNTIGQWMKMLSIVRRADQAPFVVDHPAQGLKNDALALESTLKFAMTGKWGSGKAFRAIVNYVNGKLFGLVAYVDIRSDLARHACVRELTMKVPMDAHYYLALLRAIYQDRARDKKPARYTYSPQHPSDYMDLARKMGNSMRKTEGWNAIPSGVTTNLGKDKRLLHGKVVSPKFVKLAEYIARKAGKQYVYTMSPDELVAAMTAWWKCVNVTHSKGAIAKGKNNMIVLKSSMPETVRDPLIKLFNSPANVHGEYIRIVVASGQYYEGLDLAGLAHVNLAEPMPAPLMELQAIGRGVRNCSHRGLPAQQRVVNIVRWFSAPPKNASWDALEKHAQGMKAPTGRYGVNALRTEYDRIGGSSYDMLVHERAHSDPEYLLLYNFEQIMKSAAIDCAVMGSYHPNVSCTVPKLSNSYTLSAGTRCG